jgi:hypothetical protein
MEARSGHTFALLVRVVVVVSWSMMKGTDLDAILVQTSGSLGKIDHDASVALSIELL